MKKVLAGLVTAITLLAPSVALAAKVVITCGSSGPDYDACQEGAQAWAGTSGHTVEVMPLPRDAGEQLTTLLLLLASKSSSVDVIRIDAVWPGVLASHL